MKLRISLLILLSLFEVSSYGFTNGISVDLNKGIGYTFFLDRVWGGISLSGSQRRFMDNQFVVSPRVYGNYNIFELENGGLFVGASYSDDFGLRNDSMIDKHRLLAFTLGLTAKISDKFRLASWVNVWGIRDDLIYDSTTGTRKFDSGANRQSFMDFGGLLLTYAF